MQTSYSSTPAVALAGQLGDTGIKHVETHRASVAIPFGRIVAYDSAGVCKLPTATGQTLLGAALHAHLEQSDDSDAEYAIDDAVAVGKLCRVYLHTEQDVTPADPVYVRFTANGAGTAAGQVRKDADTDKADAWTKAKFLTSASAGELVLVSINNI